MIKKVVVIAIAAMFSFGTISCREEKSAEDKMEDVADDIEDTADDIGDEIEDTADDIEDDMED